MALAVAYNTVVTAAATTNTAVWTTATTPAYQRDLVVTNSGASTCYISASAAAATASTSCGVAVPAGGSMIITQGQVPVSTIIYGFAAATPAGGLNVSVGFGSNVSYV